MSRTTKRMVGVAIALLGLSSPSLGAGPPPSSASAVASGPAASARALADDPPPSTEESPAPKAEDWKSAAEVRLLRHDARCKAYRVREWIKVHCAIAGASAVTQVAGGNKGVNVWVDNAAAELQSVGEKVRGAEIVFPCRRGDARYFELFSFRSGYLGPDGWDVTAHVSEQWVDGEPSPIVTM
jgi:hypothetical protein